MTAYSLRNQGTAGQAPLVPERMSLVYEWRTPQRDRFELWVDRQEGDGCLVAIGDSYGVELAAQITDVGAVAPGVLWRGTLAGRSQYWRTAQAAITRANLAGFSSDR